MTNYWIYVYNDVSIWTKVNINLIQKRLYHFGNRKKPFDNPNVKLITIVHAINNNWGNEGKTISHFRHSIVIAKVEFLRMDPIRWSEAVQYEARQEISKVYIRREALCSLLFARTWIQFPFETGNCSNVRFVHWGRAIITVSPGKMCGAHVTHEGAGRN